MTTRITWATALSIVMIPLLILGFLDPLEGLFLLVAGIAIAVTVRLMSQVRLPRITWITVLVESVLMAITLGVAISESMPQDQPNGDTVNNPLMTEFMIGPIPVAFLFMWLARIALIPMIAGLILYSVRLFKARTALQKG